MNVLRPSVEKEQESINIALVSAWLWLKCHFPCMSPKKAFVKLKADGEKE